MDHASRVEFVQMQMLSWKIAPLASMIQLVEHVVSYENSVAKKKPSFQDVFSVGVATSS